MAITRLQTTHIYLKTDQFFPLISFQSDWTEVTCKAYSQNLLTYLLRGAQMTQTAETARHFVYQPKIICRRGHAGFVDFVSGFGAAFADPPEVNDVSNLHWVIASDHGHRKM
jgi:hypothetical protein